jgi:polyhydroxybutyrate depolymerase
MPTSSKSRLQDALTRSASRRVRFGVFALLACWLLASITAEASFEAGKFALRSFSFEGQTRSYYVYAPTGYDGSSTALVVDIHGFGSNAGQHSAISGFRNLADSEGFLVTWPDGSSNAWNAGICCGAPMTLGTNDVGFLREVVAQIGEEAALDDERIYATGLSNGAAMSHRLACEAADLFAAVAPVAFPVPFDPMTQCEPSRPIPVAMVMGFSDEIVPYEPGFYPGAQESFEYWRDTNVCTGEIPDTTTPLAGEATCETYSNCEGGVATRLCSIVGSESAFGVALNHHVLYYNDSGYAVASESWNFMQGYRHPNPSQVPEPRASAMMLAALASLVLLRTAARRRRTP